MGIWCLIYGQGIVVLIIFNMFGNLFNGLILGNVEGFDFVGGGCLELQIVEKLQIFELGYCGQLQCNKLFIDVNVYYNISQDFLSLVIIFFVIICGKMLLCEVQVDVLYDFYVSIGLEGFVVIYVNFGEVNIYGVDLNLNYYFIFKVNVYINYFYFDYFFDENDLSNDFDCNGIVNFLDILVNVFNYCVGVGVNYSGDKWLVGLFGCWVELYNYFFSFQIVFEILINENGDFLIWCGMLIVEDVCGIDFYNYGLFGGFVMVDLNFGY